MAEATAGQERLLQILESAITAPRESGPALLERLALGLAEALGARCAAILEAVPGGAGRVRSVAYVVDGRIEPAVEYALAGTPCETAFGSTACFYPRSVADLFPEDEMLRELGAESYVGAPLRSSAGQVFGVAIAVHDRPMSETPPPQLVVAVFAARAAAELEHGRAEREWTRLLERTRRALADSGVGVWDWDARTGAVDWIEVEPLFGVEPGSFGGTFDAVMELVVPEDRPAVHEALDACREPGTDDFECRFRPILSEGPARWLEARGRAIRAPGGALERLAGTVKDVTPERAVLEELQAERATLAAVLDTTVMAVAVLNPWGEIVYANERAERVLGLQRSEILKRRYDAPEWRATDVDGGPWPDEKQPFVRVLSTGEPVFDVRHAIEWPSGERKVLSINGAPIKDREGTVVSLVFAIQDITAQTGAERELTESRERFRQYFEQSLIGIAITSPEHSYLEANLKLCELLGTGVAALADTRLSDIVHPDERREFAFVLDQLREGAVPNATGEWRLRRFDGSDVPVLIWSSAVRDEERRLRYVLSLVLDLSERKQLEEQLLHSQKLEGIGRFAGGVAHDFNNLLTAVLSYADLGESLTDDDELREMLAEIRDSGERATELTRQLLAFASRQMISPRVLELNELVRGVARLLGRVLGEDVRLQLSLRDALWHVEVDPGQIEQILVNLAANARDAMPRGGSFEITSRNVVLSGAAAHLDLSPGEYVELVVSDTGDGMDEETRRLVFEPFFTTKAMGRGSGLGLATCHGIVQQAGGRISVESAPGRGSAFRILLPRSTKPLAPEGEPAPDTASGGNETVMVVEDADAVRRVAVRILGDLGYQVLEAATPSEALERSGALEGPLDLVLCDVVLPEMSGPTLVEKLLERHPETRVLFTSGYNEEVLDLHRAPGLEELLPKPYKPGRLAARVRELLDRPARRG